MFSPSGHRASVRLLLWFTVLAGVPLAALGWLGWRLLMQERVLDAQRLREQLNNASALMARELDRALSSWEERLPAIAEGESLALPRDVGVFVMNDQGVVRRDGVLLPYYPRVAQPAGSPASTFVQAELLEFGRHDLVGAEQEYRRLADSPDRLVRASALMRLARCLRNEHRLREAVNVYGELAALDATVTAGAPAELVARRERAALFTTLGDRESARQETALLSSALSSGRYLIDRATYQFYWETLNPAEAGSHDERAGSHDEILMAVEDVWPALEEQESGRASSGSDGTPVVVVWKRIANKTAAIAGRLDTLAPTWTDAAGRGVRATLENQSGRAVWGAPSDSKVSVAKGARETGMPWTIRVTADDAGAAQQLVRSRRNLLIGGFALMALVVSTAGFVMFRSVSRELAVARLQSEFVATVSHEFRTPLTAMRHLTELLEEGDAAVERVPHYYRALAKETRRLQNLVESLLDFGRMEAGRRTYRMERTSATEIARHAIDEFTESPLGRRIAWDGPDLHDARIAPSIRADREAIGLALRNLLDNALKYSPDSSSVRVSVRSNRDTAAIVVSDEGPGMSPREQRDIFRKFVRGTAAVAMHVKGTGIGLAIAEQIVRAHGGRLQLDSAPGRGSSFSIVLPTISEAA